LEFTSKTKRTDCRANDSEKTKEISAQPPCHKMNSMKSHRILAEKTHFLPEKNINEKLELFQFVLNES
jgi:hypothetical protein